jgi:hypothetical protein
VSHLRLAERGRSVRSGAGVNRNDLQHLAAIRADEADHLFSGDLFNGSYYLYGYVVECALKACIAKNVQQYDFPDRGLVNESYTHDLRKLLRAAGLDAQLDQDKSDDPDLDKNWAIAAQWNEASRYATHLRRDATALRDAVSDPHHGVLKRIQTFW